MDGVLGLPSGALVVALTLALVALVLTFAAIAWRATILAKLGLRNIPRRWARALLIVVGLTLSTTVIGSALGTGDTMDHTVRSLVTQSLGPVDEVVVLNAPRNGSRGATKVLANPGFGGLAGANLAFFPETQASQVTDAAKGTDAIAGVTPAIVDQVTVVHAASQQLRSALTLIAVSGRYPDAFGRLTTPDGAAVDLGALAPDDVVLNLAAAQLIGGAAGQPLQVIAPDETWNARIGAVVTNAGLGGAQPTVIAPLARYQQLGKHDGQINALLVANRGGVDSARQSEPAALTLRLALADQGAAREIHAFLSQPEAQRALLDAASEERGAERQRLLALRAEAGKPQMTDRFVSLVSDPLMRRQLYEIGGMMPGGAERATVFGLMQRLSHLSVLEVKQQAIDQANAFGNVVTTVFLVLGIFSVAAGLLLIFLIFALLAADRGEELATLRAMGMSRWQIMGLFLWEGIVYDLLGAAVGALLGLGGALLMTRSLQQALAIFGFHIDWHVEPRSLLLAFAAGVLLTFVTMLIAAWRISHTSIASATKGEAVDESRGWLLGVGALLLLAGAFVWQHWHTPRYFYEPRHPLVLPGALSLALLGIMVCLTGGAALLSRRLRGASALRIESAAGLTVTGLGFVVAALWLRTLAGLPTPRGSTLDDAVTIAVGGVVLILALTWAAARALGPLLRLLDFGLSRFARLRTVIRPAAGYLGQQRLRAGLAIVMFGMVIFIMVTSLTMIDALLNAYGADAPPIAGFELRADQSSSAPIADMNQELAHAPAISRAPFSAVGSLTPEDIAVVQLGTSNASWSNTTLNAVDDGFLSGVQVDVPHRLAGDDSAAVWAALRGQPGTAVVSASLLDGTVESHATSAAGFSPLTLWVRPSDGGQPIKLTVIGVIDGRSDLDAGIYVSRTTAAGLGVALPPPASYFFALRPGYRTADAAEGLRVSFHGLTVTNLGDQLRIGQSIRLLLTRLVQGFMSMGLVAGIAALGMLGVQSVIERRMQLGTLRALGFTRWQTRASLAFESAVIAAVGITLGVALGLAMAHSLTALIAADHPEIAFAVPWSQIALTAAMAWGGSALAVMLGVWQAGRVSPAEALRVTG